MAAKLPDFQPLPPDNQASSPSPTAPPVEEYKKQIERSSFINPIVDQSSDEDRSFDPRMRRQWSVEPTIIHATRHPEPSGFSISDDLKRLHEESCKRYPELNLSGAEYVIAEIQRHVIGLILPIGIAVVIIIVLLSILFAYPILLASGTLTSIEAPDFMTMALFIIPTVGIVAAFSYISVWVYQHNKLYLTNECVIQEIQHSLFSKHQQTASLGSIEDVSYFQNGLIPTMLNYGHVRLSTEGDESTYRFYYVSNPRKQVAILTNAVEDFKNGRPVARDVETEAPQTAD